MESCFSATETFFEGNHVYEKTVIGKKFSFSVNVRGDSFKNEK